MKKILGWTYVIISSLMLLIDGLCLILFIASGISDNPIIDLQSFDLTYAFLGLGMQTLCGIWMLRKGLSKIKEVNPKQLIPYKENLDINVSGKVDFKDYRLLILNLTFNTKSWLFIVCFVLAVSIANYSNFPNGIPIFILIMIVFAALLLIVTLNSIKKQYNEAIVFQNHMHYHIDNESIRIQGETFDSTNKWAHFMKIKETKNFFLLFHGRVATFLHKKMFTTTQLNEFRKFILSLDIPKE